MKGKADDLFGDGDPLDGPRPKAKSQFARSRSPRPTHIGCPLAWLKRVLPIVDSSEQLAVALYLHRRRAVYGCNPFTVPNDALHADLGISRFVKYRTLRRLERAGIIRRSGSRSSKVTLLG
jgi:hypothetical protein